MATSWTEKLFHDLVVVALADDVVHPREKSLLEHYAGALGLSEKTCNDIMESVKKKRDRELHYDGPDSEADQIIGLLQEMADSDGGVGEEELALLAKVRKRYKKS